MYIALSWVNDIESSFEFKLCCIGHVVSSAQTYFMNMLPCAGKVNDRPTIALVYASSIFDIKRQIKAAALLAIMRRYAIHAKAMGGKNIIVFDLETQRSFDEVGGRDSFEKLGVSVLGAYLYKTDEYRIFEEKELSQFEELLGSKPLMVGFNSRKFDCAVLQPYIRFNLDKLPQLDILEEVVKAVGHRVKLDSIAQATLSESKSGSGLDALKYWREGDLESLKKYCLDDVRITRRIYEYGANNGELFFMSKYGMAKSVAKVSWKIEHPEGEVEQQMNLF